MSDGKNSGLLGFGVVPVPMRALEALSRGGISPDKPALLVLLYGRATFQALGNRRPTPLSTLMQIVEGLGGTDSPDTVRKRMERMRDEGWFTYQGGWDGRGLY